MAGLVVNADEPLTRTGWVERKLRTEIIAGSLGPGDRISVPDLARDWNVSPTPFREVLPRLAAEGLVHMTPQRGVRVAEMSVEDMRDIYEVRKLVEPPAVRIAVESHDDEYEARLRSVWVPLEDAYSRDPLDRVTAEQAHRDFHLAILDAGNSPWLRRIAKMLSDHSARYRILGTSARGGSQAVHEEHRLLFEACIAGDADLAEQLLVQHLNRTLESVPDRLHDA